MSEQTSESDFGLALPEMNEDESPEVYMLRVEELVAQQGWQIEMNLGVVKD